MTNYKRIANLKGPQGDPGPAPHLGIGDVQAVANETRAAAWFTGVRGEQKLNLDLPRGIPGPGAVPADEAVGEYVDTPGTQTADALLRRHPSRAEFTQATSELSSMREEFERTQRLFVNALDYGATGDGETDDTAAILDAIGDGGRSVYFPAGEYRFSESLTVPSNTEIYGAGRGQTVFKIHDEAPVTMWGFTNRNKAEGNQNLFLHDFTIDWNIERTGSDDLPATGGGSTGSCITLGNVQYGWLSRIDAIGGGRHGIDITSASVAYPYRGDMPISNAEGPSRYIWIDNCYAGRWADDGFTTHHSEFIWISNCHADTPRRRGNQNAIEIDDGSRRVFLSNNSSEGCYAGIEIKAHANAPAPREIYINGHFSYRDCRSYNFRHIGHHSGSDPMSVSAFDIIASDLISIYPNNDKGFQNNTNPRSLVISAYKRVAINGFTAVGDPDMDHTGTGQAIAIQYRASDISLTGVNISGFRGRGRDMYIGGSSARVSIFGAQVSESALEAIHVTSGARDVRVYGCTFLASDLGGPAAINASANTPYGELYVDPGTIMRGYNHPILKAGFAYASGEDLRQAPGGAPSGARNLRGMREVGRSYYMSTNYFDGLNASDKPSGASGAYVLTVKRHTSDSVLRQELERNTYTPASNMSYWRLISTDGTQVSPWRRHVYEAA